MSGLQRWDAPPSRYGSPSSQVVQGDGLWTDGASGALARALVARIGPVSRVAVISDPVVAALPWFEAALSAFVAGLGDPEVVRWTDVPSDPTGGSVARASAAVGPVSLVLGIGGGSVMDTAKGVARWQVQPGPLARLRGYGEPPEGVPPVVVVPTTAGTGSEGQSFAVLSDDTTHAKIAVGCAATRPVLGILDPLATRSCPPSVTAIAGLDALVHAVEASVTTAGSPASHAHAASAWALLRPNLPRAVADGDDLDVRRAMQRGAAMAGEAIEAGMLGAAHAAANPLSARFGVPHGVAVGLMLPPTIRLAQGHAGAVAAYADRLRAVGLAAGDDPARTLAADVEALTAQLGVDRDLRAWGVDPAAVEALAADAATQWTGTFHPVPVDEAAFRRAYRDALREGA